MIDYVQGRIAGKAPTRVLLQTGPVRLEISVPLSTSQQLPDPGDDAGLWIHLIWKEDGPSLYGFSSAGERDLFRLLIQVQGVGPRAGLSLLSHLPPAGLVREIRERSVEGLTQVPGIGPKTAGRILVDLGPRIDRLRIEGVPDSGDAGVAGASGNEDAVHALTALGYPPKDARRVVERVCRENPGIHLDEVIRLALRTVSRGMGA